MAPVKDGLKSIVNDEAFDEQVLGLELGWARDWDSQAEEQYKFFGSGKSVLKVLHEEGLRFL